MTPEAERTARQIADEIVMRRNLTDKANQHEKRELELVIHGLLLALTIALGRPDDWETAEKFASRR